MGVNLPANPDLMGIQHVASISGLKHKKEGEVGKMIGVITVFYNI